MTNVDINSLNRNFQDLTRRRFGRLTVISYAGKKNDNRTAWLCKCDCGNEKTVIGKSLKLGVTNSCGCIRKELNVSFFTKHGQSIAGKETSEYITWKNIKKRCTDTKTPEYHNYGGRGITICERWLNSFENFYADMGRKPTPKHSIDRIDNNGNYEPNNCKWATRKEQANNVRSNIIIIIKNVEYTLAQLCNKYNMKYQKVWKRLQRGWSVERALNE